MGLIALTNREARLLRRPPSLDEIRPDASRSHQAHRAVRAARGCTTGPFRDVVHVDRLTTAVDQGGGDDLPALQGPLSSGRQTYPWSCDDAHRRRDTRLRIQPAEGVVHQ